MESLEERQQYKKWQGLEIANIVHPMKLDQMALRLT